MQMQSTKPLNENVPVGSGRAATVTDYRQNSDIRKSRTVVLIILGIELVFAVFYLIQRSIDVHRYYALPADVRNQNLSGSFIGSLIAAILSLIYILVFIFVVVKYIRLGILICAWLGAIKVIFDVIIVVLAIIVIVAAAARKHSASDDNVARVVVVVLAALSAILSILLIVFSFKLAKLLKMQEVYQLV